MGDFVVTSFLFRVGTDRVMATIISILCFCNPGHENTALGQDRDATASDIAVANAATEAMKKATLFMTSQLAVHGGYVYDVSLDLKTRRGEGAATATEIWVQPPGTPTVGGAYIRAFEATGEEIFLDAATQCAQALMHGQLESGCWTDRVDFDPNGKNTGLYRHQKGNAKGRNYSTLDDDKSQSALRLLIAVDRAYEFKNEAIHESVMYGLESLLTAQFANGGFPQGWAKPVEPGIVVKASFPKHAWRTEGKFKNYWDFETLNDGLAGTVSKTLQLAYETYRDERYRNAMLKFGDFLILAQLPEPQPAWAQQYNHMLQPIWARKFEPPAVSGRESEDVIETLLYLTETTGERKFLAPVPAAIRWLKGSMLPDRQIARFYELETNRPLYLTKDDYTLTYDDANVPTHYGFKSKCNVMKLEARYQAIANSQPLRTGLLPNSQANQNNLKSLRPNAERILREIDTEGRWVSSKMLLESALFSKNLTLLAEFVAATKISKKAP
jgi:PelA/Pel-15E family pectate lyase